MSEFTPPYSPPPPKKGCGCITCGCTTLLGLVLVMVLLTCGGIYMMDSWLNGLLTSKETDVYEGTQDEKATVKKKISDLQASIKNSTETTTKLTMPELNVMIANTPPDWKLQHHLYLSSSDNVLHAQVAFPLKQLISWVGDGNLPLDIDFVPEIKGGTVTLDIKTIKYPGGTLEGTPLEQASDSINQQFKQAIDKDPKLSADLAHIESLTVEDDSLVITTH